VISDVSDVIAIHLSPLLSQMFGKRQDRPLWLSDENLFKKSLKNQ